MADDPKATWPKTPDGTTDWQVVFEDPTTGFIPLITKAQSSAALQMSATVIIQKLFTRRNDADLCAQLIARLGTIVAQANGDMAKVNADVTILMREIKDQRIELARVFVERKEAGAAIDRRASLWWKIDKILRPKVLIPVGGVFILALAGLVFMMLQSTLSPKEPPIREAAASSLATPTIQSQKPPPPKKASKTFPIWFKTLRWPLMSAHTQNRPQYYSVTLFVRQADHKIEICRLLPTIMDRFYLSFNDMMPPARMARKKELIAVGRTIKDYVNRILPASYVTNVQVARYGTRDFHVAARPPYCKSPSHP